MNLREHLVVVRGAGDLATGVIYRLHKAGFPVIALELANPLVVRRKVALATAVLNNDIQIEDMHGRLAHSTEEALALTNTPTIPVLISPELRMPRLSAAAHSAFRILIDARMAKRNINTTIDQASLVIALGPGFTAGVDCHAVIETKRGHRLGRVIWQGAALPNTGTPGIVAGKGAERVLRAPCDGSVEWCIEIGDMVNQGKIMGFVAATAVTSPFTGVVRGLIANGTAVTSGLKIGDVDARADREACFTISDKALAIGGGVLEAVFTHLSNFREV